MIAHVFDYPLPTPGPYGWLCAIAGPSPGQRRSRSPLNWLIAFGPIRRDRVRATLDYHGLAGRPAERVAEVAAPHRISNATMTNWAKTLGAAGPGCHCRSSWPPRSAAVPSTVKTTSDGAELRRRSVLAEHPPSLGRSDSSTPFRDADRSADPQRDAALVKAGYTLTYAEQRTIDRHPLIRRVGPNAYRLIGTTSEPN